MTKSNSASPLRSPGGGAGPAVPHGGVRPFHQKSTCLTNLTFEPCVVQIWSRTPRFSGGTKPLNSTVRMLASRDEQPGLTSLPSQKLISLHKSVNFYRKIRRYNEPDQSETGLGIDSLPDASRTPCLGIDLLHINVQQFRGGLVFKAHELLYHSTRGLRAIKKQREEWIYSHPGGTRLLGMNIPE